MNMATIAMAAMDRMLFRERIFSKGRMGGRRGGRSERAAMSEARGVWLLVQQPDEAADRCYLFTDGFARLLQLALACSSVLLLFVKRQLEFPKRPMLVWALDVAKQCLASLFLHCVSIVTSVLLVQRADDPDQDDECGIYFVTFMLDVTFGVLLLVLLIRGIHSLAERYNWENITDCGYYGDPPQLRIWWRQTIAYGVAVLIMKTVTTTIIWVLYPWLSRLATELFRGFTHHRHLELSLVMIVIPGLCNSLQFWVLDSYLKTSAEHWGYKLSTAMPDEKFWIQRPVVLPATDPGSLTPTIPEQVATTSPL